jgi:hypothetical protein
MVRLLNSRTNTVHNPGEERRRERAECGSLEHVSQGRIRVVTDDELRGNGEVHRCGNCFEDAGGY